MLKNYWTIALRHLRRHKGYTFINVAGLAVGLACVLLIALYVRHELSVDRFHEKAGRIVRVEMDVEGTDGTRRWAMALEPVGEALREGWPEVERYARLQSLNVPLVVRGDRRFYEDRFFFTEPDFFALFDVRLTRGDAAALARPNTIVLSETMAAKYFPDEDPLGRTIDVTGKWERETLTFEVAGVVEDFPSNMHFQADFLASWATRASEEPDRTWQRIAFTYLLVRPGVGVAALEAKGKVFDRDVLLAHLGGRARLAFTPLADIHLYGKTEGDIAPQGDIRYVYLFSAIALLILGIACINYMNLATARAARRAAEVGIRKVVGAQRRQLVVQFLAESVLYAVLALVLGLALAQLLLPVVQPLLPAPLRLSLSDVPTLAGLVAAAVVVGLAAGSYPAFFLSSFRPASVLKGGVRMKAWPLLRKALIVAQFVVTVALLVGTVVVQRQLHYVQHTRLGFDEEQMLVVRTRDGLKENAEAFRRQVAGLAGVKDVAFGSGIPGEPTAISFFDEGEIEGYAGDPDASFVFSSFWVDARFVPTLGLELAGGRNFSEDQPTDAAEAVLVNETAARRLGWDEPLGKRLGRERAYRVVGVLRDFHVVDLRREIDPVIFFYRPASSTYATVKLQTADVAGTLAAVEDVWEAMVPGQPFEFSFLDEDFDAMYRAEERLGRLFGAFAALAVLIACLGLFGLAAYTAEQRNKEIGIRRVLGASVASLVGLLSRDLLALVALAFALAVPATYLAAQRWLEGFAYRIDVSWPIFVVAGLAAFGVAFVTVGLQALRAATSDPVRHLRD